MGISFYKSGESNGSNYVKFPLRSSAIFNNKNDDNKFCFLYSVLAKRHPSEITSVRVSNSRRFFDQLKIDGFDFSNWFKCSDMKRFKKNYLCLNRFESNFYQDQKNWKQIESHWN